MYSRKNRIRSSLLKMAEEEIKHYKEEHIHFRINGEGIITISTKFQNDININLDNSINKNYYINLVENSNKLKKPKTDELKTKSIYIYNIVYSRREY